MSNGVPKRIVGQIDDSPKQKSSNGDLGCLFAGFCLFAIPGLIVYFNAHLKQIEISIKCIVGILLLIMFVKVIKGMSMMFERLMMNADEKEFSKLTIRLEPKHYVALKVYFKTTSTDVKNANNFLKSCRGVAFLDAYSKSPILDNVGISKMIIETEREEQIVSCAVDILKEY